MQYLVFTEYVHCVCITFLVSKSINYFADINLIHECFVVFNNFWYCSKLLFNR
jgi:hypothetical protein